MQFNEITKDGRYDLYTKGLTEKIPVRVSIRKDKKGNVNFRSASDIRNNNSIASSILDGAIFVEAKK